MSPAPRSGSISTLRVALLYLFLLTGCRSSDPAPVAVTIEPVQGEETLAPTLFRAGDSIFVSWLEPEPGDRAALWFSRWNGDAWVDPYCAWSGERWVKNQFDIPRVLVDGWDCTAVWPQRIGETRHGYGVKVVQTRMDRDDGVILGPTWLHADTSDCEHGFASLLQQDSSVRAVWLDGRETPSGGATALRTALVSPGGIRDEAVLDSSVCDCCPTAVARCADGSLVVAYRDRSPEEVRDIAIVRQSGGAWSPPRVVNRDEWKIAGCPVNGPSLAASDSVLALAWFALSGGVDPSVQVVFSRNGGESFGAPIRVDRHHAEGRVDVAFLDDGRALVVWLEVSDSANTLWARPVSPHGKADSARLLVETAPGGLAGIPTVATFGRMVVVAWTESGEVSRVRTAELGF